MVFISGDKSQETQQNILKFLSTHPFTSPKVSLSCSESLDSPTPRLALSKISSETFPGKREGDGKGSKEKKERKSLHY